jgi:hypothetical protein
MAVTLSAADWHIYDDGSGDAATIAEAAGLCSTGDVIYIHAGTYVEAGILFDGKDVMIVMPDGRVYLDAPVQGSGTGVTVRAATAGFWLESFYFAGFDTALSIEDASPFVNFVTIGDCGTGIAISGASAPFVGNSVIDTCTTAVDVSGAAGASIQNLTIVGCTTGVSVSGGDATVTRCIIYGCGTGLACGGGTITLDCNNLYGNMVQYSGCAAGPSDFYLDPIFCFYTPPSTNPYYLHSDSPCISSAEPCGPGTYVGFYGFEGCTGTSVEESTWGTIKSLYR